MIKHYCFNVTNCQMVSILSQILVLDTFHPERSNNFVPLSMLLRYQSQISKATHDSDSGVLHRFSNGPSLSSSKKVQN